MSDQVDSKKRSLGAPSTVGRKRKIVDASAISSSDASNKSQKRWRAHQMLDDYVSMVGNLLLPGEGYVESLGLESHRSTALGYLRSPLRRPTVWEDWSPKEIATFEAALMQHGKEFSLLSKKYLPNKSCKEVVAFYYVWKKTNHYQQWKAGYEPDDGAWVMDDKASTPSKPSSVHTNGRS